jgi:hypothetical protein
MTNAIREKQKQRMEFLKELYERSGGDPMMIFPDQEIGDSVGLSRTECQQVIHYLMKEGLVDGTIDQALSISHYGIKEYESAATRPDEPTNHFMPMSLIYVETMTNSQIQQGTVGSHQHGEWSRDEFKTIAKIVRLIRADLGSLELNRDDQAQIEIDLKTLELQQSAPRPNTSAMRHTLSSIRSILESAAGSATASGIGEASRLIRSIVGE